MRGGFRYAFDPLCCVSAGLYLLNRVWLTPQWGAEQPWLGHYFNDVFLIPCVLPMVLGIQRIVGLRRHDRPPSMGEILGTLALWAVLFEGVFPLFPGKGTADPMDVVAYAAGAAVAAMVWGSEVEPPGHSKSFAMGRP
jgi:hypothetical protein